MTDPDDFQDIPARARFGDSMQKIDCFRSDRLFVGLNCLTPGQSQREHVHANADKFYYVVSGRASITVGLVSRAVEAGMLVTAPAGTPHGVAEVYENTVLLVAMSPPPGGAKLVADS